MSGELVGKAANLTAAHGVGLAGEREGSGAADAASGEMYGWH